MAKRNVYFNIRIDIDDDERTLTDFVVVLQHLVATVQIMYNAVSAEVSVHKDIEAVDI